MLWGCHWLVLLAFYNLDPSDVYIKSQVEAHPGSGYQKSQDIVVYIVLQIFSDYFNCVPFLKQNKVS